MAGVVARQQAELAELRALTEWRQGWARSIEDAWRDAGPVSRAPHTAKVSLARPGPARPR
jgi:ribosomal protein S12 methylthiotransferase accessory factor YcaO